MRSSTRRTRRKRLRASPARPRSSTTTSCAPRASKSTRTALAATANSRTTVVATTATVTKLAPAPSDICAIVAQRGSRSTEERHERKTARIGTATRDSRDVVSGTNSGVCGSVVVEHGCVLNSRLRVGLRLVQAHLLGREKRESERDFWERESRV